MKSCKSYILLLLLLCAGLWSYTRSDDYVDDVYYSEQTAFEAELSRTELTPYYDKKKMQELHFVQDSTTGLLRQNAPNYMQASDAEPAQGQQNP